MQHAVEIESVTKRFGDVNAVGDLSLFPPATPMLMLLRLAAPGSIPLWQPFLGCGLVILTTILFIYAAGKIFRMGILMQGEAASFRRMLSWVIRS